MSQHYENEGSAASRSKAFVWLMQRVTGVGLVLFLVLHFWVQHMPTGFLATAGEYSEILKTLSEASPEVVDAIADGKIKEALPGEHVITYSKVLERLRTPLWRIIDILLLLFALLHGMLGLMNVLGDYMKRVRLRKAVVFCCWAVTLFLAGQGIVVIMAVGMK
ncbi:MAG: succinate dehydrogenase hydrophobic membrane anchor subunit [Chlorobium phaeobacteroides]|uniref:Succinate dehydrogenase, membrane subunit, putative n=1 Tax=Chlorobium phaeobacteroides (strain BS1) TaxID=331678 RepID=B3EQB1_CHLPB|nr:succinate dehydrogenase hydrophobic membrane anchor subunit [Chlorobium phaeobacteroides]MBL6956195.1 succinate dehydrogenase hydrophobic membrane anchor subunit [Chlorobium phaeobacteroides]